MSAAPFSTVTFRQVYHWVVREGRSPILPPFRRSFAVLLDVRGPPWFVAVAMHRIRKSSRAEALLIRTPRGLRVAWTDCPIWSQGALLSASSLHWLDDLGRETSRPADLVTILPPPLPARPERPPWRSRQAIELDELLLETFGVASMAAAAGG